VFPTDNQLNLLLILSESTCSFGMFLFNKSAICNGNLSYVMSSTTSSQHCECFVYFLDIIILHSFNWITNIANEENKLLKKKDKKGLDDNLPTF